MWFLLAVALVIPPDDAEALRKQLKSADVKQRVEALHKASMLDAEQFKSLGKEIVMATADKNESVREAALESVEKHYPVMHQCLVTFLADESIYKRTEAVDRFPTTEEPTLLVPLLLNAGKGYIRLGAERTQRGEGAELGTRLMSVILDIDNGNKEAIRQLGFAATNPEAHVRAHAMRICKRVAMEQEEAHKDLLPVIAAGLREKELAIILVPACQAAGACGEKGKVLLPTLRKLKVHPDESVRQAAAEAAKAIES